MLKKVVLSLMLIAILQTGVFAYYDSNRAIKVGISDNSFGHYRFKSREFSSKSGLKLIDTASAKELKTFQPDEVVKISIRNGVFEVSQSENIIEKDIKGPISIESSSPINITDLKRKGKPALYKGKILAVKSIGNENAFSVINLIEIETYLRGVVPNEMPTRFGLEALKAQAVAARNYALRPRTTSFREFDICDSQACQVYFGANTEESLSDKALEETKGIVALHNHELILALYSSTAGGHTESYENAFNIAGTKSFPAKPLPYLKGVPDSPLTQPLDSEESARAFYLTYPETYDNKSPFFRWQREWQGAELEETLKNNLKKMLPQGFITPKHSPETNFGTLKDIKIIKRGVSGKIIELEIIGTENTIVVQKELVIRRLFQKNNNALPSANIVFDIEYNQDGTISTILANGGGFGHGVGLSQFGAAGMAALNKKFEDILSHYYSKIYLATEPFTLKNDYDNNSGVQKFYTTAPKANLIIEHKFEFAKLTVNVNGVQEQLNITPNLSKYLKHDISDFLRYGNNTITYYLEPQSGGKPIKLYIQIEQVPTK